MENMKLRLANLAMTVGIVAFLVLAFFMPDHRLFIALALALLAIKSTVELSSEFIVNTKTVLVMVLICAALILGIAAMYFFFGYLGWRRLGA
jgi:hypothetical protein